MKTLSVYLWVAGCVICWAGPASATSFRKVSLEEQVRESEVIVQGTLEQISLKVSNYLTEGPQRITVFQTRGVLIGQAPLKGEVPAPLILTLYWIQRDSSTLSIGHMIMGETSGIWFLKRWSRNPNCYSPIDANEGWVADDPGVRKEIQRLVEKNRLLGRHFAGTREDFPEGLYEAYARFIQAVETGRQAEIESLCFPGCITFTAEPRPEVTRLRGQDMNLPFLKSIFNPLIWSIRKDTDDLYMIRTSNSIMNFVNTRAGGWKLYRYADKPIE